MIKLEKRSYPPGQHGMAKRGKKSEYAVQLMEKQKLNTYGILENNSEVFKKASALKVLLVKFFYNYEARLDNVVSEWVLLLLEELLDNCFSQTHYC
jgi:small subunit ribosomal protein S4